MYIRLLPGGCMKLDFLFVIVTVLALFGCTNLLDPNEPGNLVPKTVTEDPTIPRLELNGTVFHAETFGDPDNQVVIILHDGPGRDYRSFLNLSVLHEDDYYIVFWDQRGSGLSKRHDDNDINLEIYLDDLDKLVNLYVTENYPRVSLLGLGWGAMLATAYVNRNPQMVNGLILSEPFAFTGSHLEAIKDDIFDFSLSSEWYNEYVWSTDVISGDGHEKRDYQFLLKFADSMPNLNEGSDNPRPVWRLGAAANKGIYDSLKGSGDKFSFDFTKNLSQFTEEVLFIRSKENKVLDLEHHERLMQFFTDATLLTINNVGHDLIWLNPGAVLEFVRM